MVVLVECLLLDYEYSADFVCAVLNRCFFAVFMV